MDGMTLWKRLSRIGPVENVQSRRTEMERYGYVRVSSKEQHIDRQLRALRSCDIQEDHIFCDYQSGKDFNRPEYRKMLRRMKAGDTLFIKSIDRLGRNYDEIIQQWGYITKKMDVDIVVLDMPLLDTRQGKDLVGHFVSDLVLQILSFVAENERQNIRQRQAEGIAAARARGVHFGRPSIPLPENFEEIFRSWKNRELTVKEAAELCGMPPSTFYEKARRYGKEHPAE